MANVEDFQNAVNWAINQEEYDDLEETIRKVKDESGNVDRSLLVIKVREYFNENNIEYDTFSYQDLEPILD